MLKHLYIRNYALIRSLDMDFSEGFSVLTGETGAGKSIILGALGLITGERADTKAIREGEDKCVIEALFSLDTHLQAFFEAQDLDYSETCIIRRELTAQGKSRSFVNDTPVSLTTLRELSAHLIDIHSQHANLLLRDDTFLLAMADAAADNHTQKEAYTEAYKRYKATQRRLEDTLALVAKQREEEDYTAFQYRQLEEARLRKGEEEELEEEIRALSHAEETQQALAHTNLLLDSEQGGALVAIKEALGTLRRVEDYLPPSDRLSERLESVYIELRDIAEEANHTAERTEADPARLAEAEERIDTLHALMQKHRKQSVAELEELRDNLAQQLQQHAHTEEDLETLRKQAEQEREAMTEAANRLTKSRTEVCIPLAERTVGLLGRLGIAHPQVRLEITETADYGPSGKDKLRLLFASNKNQTPRPAGEIASGGETARLMLCLKMLTAERQGLPTLVFDEADTGVSGETAGNMGEMMRQLGENRQVLAITHLPQTAAKGDKHYKVYKTDSDTHTETHIHLLTDEERVREIATLLSDDNVTEAALTHAGELLKH